MADDYDYDKIYDWGPTFEIPKVHYEQMPFFIDENQVCWHYAIPKGVVIEPTENNSISIIKQLKKLKKSQLK